MPNIDRSVQDFAENGPWTGIGLEIGDAKINSASLKSLLSWLTDVEGGTGAAYFRVVFSRPGVTCQLEGKIDPIPDAIKEEKKVGIHLVRAAKLADNKVL